MYYFFFNTAAPSTSVITIKLMKIKNIILATDAAPADIPAKPSKPATRAITKKIAVHFNMSVFVLRFINRFVN